MQHVPAQHFQADLSKEATLLTAVVETAILDARYGDRDAWTFLTATTGDWKRSRDHYASLLGFDPDLLRQHVLATMDPPAADKPRKRVIRETAPYCPRPGTKTARVHDAMQGRGRMLTEDVAKATGLPSGDVSGAIATLYNKGLIQRIATGVYSAPP